MCFRGHAEQAPGENGEAGAATREAPAVDKAALAEAQEEDAPKESEASGAPASAPGALENRFGCPKRRYSRKGVYIAHTRAAGEAFH